MHFLKINVPVPKNTLSLCVNLPFQGHASAAPPAAWSPAPWRAPWHSTWAGGSPAVAPSPEVVATLGLELLLLLLLHHPERTGAVVAVASQLTDPHAPSSGRQSVALSSRRGGAQGEPCWSDSRRDVGLCISLVAAQGRVLYVDLIFFLLRIPFPLVAVCRFRHA